MTMSGRDRVLAAINHEEPDRVPIVIGASNATGMKVAPYHGLKRLLGVDGEDRYIYDWPELGTILPDEAVLERLHSDVRGVFDAFPAETIVRNRARPPHSPFIDDWGSGQVEIVDGTWYPAVHPMADALTIDAIERYPWPDMDDPSRVAHVHDEAARLVADGRYAILATPWLLFPFERAFAMQGLQQFLMNLAVEPDFAEALLKKIAERCKVLMGHFLDALGDDVDIIKIGDDLGTEQSLLMSPAMYRRILKPIHADYIAYIRKRTRAKVFFHTDGDVFDLLDDFVEIGVDILNPVQSGSGKLGNLAEVKRRYGTRLAFCGAIDTQQVLPTGTPGEVRAEVRRAIGTLGPGGGYLLAAVHTIMNEVPPENVLAMVDAAVEFGTYPIRG
jgi:uroporphyrinogen decarboxylase